MMLGHIHMFENRLGIMHWTYCRSRSLCSLLYSSFSMRHHVKGLVINCAFFVLVLIILQLKLDEYKTRSFLESKDVNLKIQNASFAEDVVIYNRIPKTGGTFFSNIFRLTVEENGVFQYASYNYYWRRLYTDDNFVILF